MSQECNKNIPRGQPCQSCNKLLRDVSDLNSPYPYVISEFTMSATRKKDQYYFCSDACNEAFIKDNKCVKCNNLAGIKNLELKLKYHIEEYGHDDCFTRGYQRRFDDIGACKRQIISDKVYCNRCLFACYMCNGLFLDKEELNTSSICNKCVNIIEDLRENYSCVFCKNFYKKNNYDSDIRIIDKYKVCTDCLYKINELNF